MCAPHRVESDRATTERFGQAGASNSEGWAAITYACARLELPHLPNGLAARLAGAEDVMFELREPEELVAEARAVIEAAGWFRGRPVDFALALALGAEDDEPWLPEWLRNLVLDLGHAGLGAEAVAVGEALSRVDPLHECDYAADVGVGLATAGDTAEARTRIEANLKRWPDDLWVRAHAGDALQILGDTKGAEAHFLAALDLAEEADDFEARSDLVERLENLGRPLGPRTRIRLVDTDEQSGAASGPRPGRNDPCFCGSGRKYKRCHGQRS